MEYENVYIFFAGWKAWKENKYPIESETSNKKQEVEDTEE